jgi:metal-dependent amidase/aminoacylase/carboxypeptidase family protein
VSSAKHRQAATTIPSADRISAEISAIGHTSTHISAEAMEWRRELHCNPQTIYEEVFASNLVADKLNEWGIEHMHSRQSPT